MVSSYLSGGLHGYDKQGSPVRYELFGALDMKGLMHAASKSDLVKSKLLACETVLHLCQQQSSEVGADTRNLCVFYTSTCTYEQVFPRDALPISYPTALILSF